MERYAFPGYFLSSISAGDRIHQQMGFLCHPQKPKYKLTGNCILIHYWIQQELIFSGGFLLIIADDIINKYQIIIFLLGLMDVDASQIN